MTTYDQTDFNTRANEFTALDFFVRQLLCEVNTATLVKVVACTNAGGVSAAGTVDVILLVNQIDGQGNATQHGQVNGLPYCRYQGGVNAIIIDPAPGDIGVAVFAHRDISTVKNTKAQSNPGSFRKFDYSDGIYVSTVLGAAPTQYVDFSGSGISVVSNTGISLMSGGHTLTINSSGITLDGIVFGTHQHTGVQTGSGNTGGPIA